MLIQSFRGAAKSLIVVLGLALAVSSCFFIVDKDRIKIAMFNGKPITRGDFDKVIRDMPPDQRPLIRTKGDVRNALQGYLDKRVKYKNAEELLALKKIFVPREMAEALLRMRKPMLFVDIKNPEDYKMSARDVEYMKEEREIKIDEMLKDLEAEEGIYYRISEAIQESLIDISQTEYEEEYEIRKAELKHPERVAFTGVLIPGGTPESRAAGTALAKKLHAGTTPADAAKEYAGQNAQIIEAELENDPGKFKFASFWDQASGKQIGDVFGPVFVQGWTETTVDAQGKQTQRPYPDGFLVCVVTGRTDETPKTLEESKPELQRNILYAKIMQQLRTENGVQIFDDKLPDPGMYEQQR